MIDLVFPFPKDPQDVSWYCLHSFDLISLVVSVQAIPVGGLQQVLVNPVLTVGDIVRNAQDLVVESAQVNTVDLRLSDNTIIPAGYGILFQASQGIPGTQYSVRVQYESGSSLLFRSVTLMVAGG